MFKIIALLLAGLFVISFNSGCSGPQAEKNLTIWAMGEEGIKLPELVKLFEKENPGIKVKIQAIPWSAAHEKLVTAAIGNILPDVCQMGTTWMSGFQAMDVLEPLNEYISRSEIVKHKNYFPGSWSTCVINETVFGIPWYVDTRVMFYRKDLFEKAGIKNPPVNWNELIKFGKRLVEDTDNDGKIDKYAYAIPIQDWQVLYPFIWQNKGELIDVKNRKSLATTKEVKEAVEFYISFFRENLSPTGAAGIDLMHAFRTGYYKMFFSGPWMLEILDRELPELKGKWAVAVMPKKHSPASFVGGCNFVIFRNSKNKDLAWKFVEFASRPEIQVEWYKITKSLPSVKSAWQDKLFTETPMLNVFAKQLEYAKSPPNIPEWEQIASKVHTRVEEAVLGKKSVDVALSELNSDISQILEKAK